MNNIKDCIRLSFNEDMDKPITILPISEKEEDDDFWTQMYIDQYGDLLTNEQV